MPALPHMNFDPRTEKNLATLLPKAQVIARQFMERAVAELKPRGCDVRIISGSRTYKEQDALYAQGRTVAPLGKSHIVTNARGGQSNHNFGIAFDIGIFEGGRYLEESPLYRQLGPIGEACGLEWGGRWKTITDEPHYQVPTGLTLAQLRIRVAAGKPIL